jgi:predicted nucleic acid-binding protein
VTLFVVDANVAIKWVLTEIHSDTATRLLDNSYELLVPDFFFSEVGNVLWKRVRRGEINPETANAYLNAILDVDLRTFNSQRLISQALEIAIVVQQAVYDCVYLTLAIVNQCQMVTADERFYNALQNHALASHLCWVENLP